MKIDSGIQCHRKPPCSGTCGSLTRIHSIPLGGLLDDYQKPFSYLYRCSAAAVKTASGPFYSADPFYSRRPTHRFRAQPRSGGHPPDRRQRPVELRGIPALGLQASSTCKRSSVQVSDSEGTDLRGLQTIGRRMGAVGEQRALAGEGDRDIAVTVAGLVLDQFSGFPRPAAVP